MLTNAVTKASNMADLEESGAGVRPEQGEEEVDGMSGVIVESEEVALRATEMDLGSFPSLQSSAVLFLHVFKVMGRKIGTRLYQGWVAITA